MVKTFPVGSVLLMLIASAATAEPIAPGSIKVVDGDTVSVRGKLVRLIGFDTPEAGSHASYESERTIAARATFRLRQIIAGGGLDLSLLPCAPAALPPREPKPATMPALAVC